MRSKQDVLRFVDVQIHQRGPDGYADVALPPDELRAHTFLPSDLPWWARIRPDGEEGGPPSRLSFVPDRHAEAWDVIVEHVIDPEAWPAMEPVRDYADAVAADLVERTADRSHVEFGGLEQEGRGAEEDDVARVAYRLAVYDEDLADAVATVREVDRELRETLAAQAADADVLYPEEDAA